MNEPDISKIQSHTNGHERNERIAASTSVTSNKFYTVEEMNGKMPGYMKHLFGIAVVALGLFFVTEISAHPAWGIVVDRTHQVYFSDLETVWKIDTRGNLSKFRPGVSGRHVHEIKLGENGVIFGVDNSYEPPTQRFISALWNMTPAGEFSYILAPTHNPPKGMSNWVDGAGNRYRVGRGEDSSRDIFVLKRTPAGRVTTLAGNRKAGDAYRQVLLDSAGGCAFGKDGSLHFAEGANVRKVSMTGRLELMARDVAIENRAASPLPKSTSTSLFGIALDTKDNVFVADYGNRRVLKIESDGGKTSTVVTSEHPWSPTGVAWKDDNFYVLEFGFTPPTTYATRVRKISPDGKITVLATVGAPLTASVSDSTLDELPNSVTKPTGATPFASFAFASAFLARPVSFYAYTEPEVAHSSLIAAPRR